MRTSLIVAAMAWVLAVGGDSQAQSLGETAQRESTKSPKLATVHVDSSGVVSENCGALNRPCVTIARAMERVAEGGTILLAPGTYTEHGLRFTRALTVRGTGQGNTVIDGRKKGRVIHVAPEVSVTLEQLTVANGRVAGKTAQKPGAPGGAAKGAGILNEGDLTLRHVAVTGNEVVGGPGATGPSGKTGGAGRKGRGGRSGLCKAFGCEGAAGSHQSSAGGSGGSGGPGGPGDPGGTGGAALGAGIYNAHALRLIDARITANMALGGAGGQGGPGGRGGAGGRGGNGGGQGKVWGCYSTHPRNGGRGGGGGRGGPGGLGGVGGLASGGGIYNEDAVLAVEATVVEGNTAAAGKGGSPGVAGAGGPGGKGGKAGHRSKSKVCGRNIPKARAGAAGPAGKKGPPGEAGKPAEPGGGNIASAGTGATVLWPIGKPIDPPEEALDKRGQPYGPPEYEPPEAARSFYWDPLEKQLYPVQGGSSTLKWRVTDEIIPKNRKNPHDPEDPVNRRVEQSGMSVWPSKAQIHVAGAPVELSPKHHDMLSFVDVRETSGQARSDGARFTNDTSGSFSLLMFARGPKPDITRHPPHFIVVRTVAAVRHLETETSCAIGKPVEDPRHTDERNGFVLDSLAPFDAETHDRENRSGAIIPVNTSAAVPDHTLVVAWYENGAHGISWPTRPVRYDCDWPGDSDALVIADPAGEPLPEEKFPEASVYHQPDRNRAGFNPNDEHAWVGSANGRPTLYALRVDPGASETGAGQQILLKYQDPAKKNAPAFEVFRVLAENADHKLRGRSIVTVGTVIEPPKAIRKASSARCAATFVTGPVHRDHRHHLWAKAAEPNDNEITIGWFYPLRQDFWHDPDNDGEPDKKPGDCVPWLDAYAGNPGEPYRVRFLTRWPAEGIRELRVGQTLTEGLRHQRSVEVVHGEDIGIRLFDPWAERTIAVDFPKLPDGVPWSSRDGRQVLRDLPRSLQNRIFFDPTNKRLGVHGGIDTRFGDLLYPNILTHREAEQLKALSDDEGFRTAVDRLHKESRRAENHTRKLVQGEKAITAGAVKGTGYVTLVYGDHEEVSGSPISMQVFQVDCPVFAAPVYAFPPDNLFDESITLRYGADFGGEAGRLRFEWFYKRGAVLDPVRADADGSYPGWKVFEASTPRGDASAARGTGAIDVTVGKKSALSLHDLAVLARYRGYEDICGIGPGPTSGATVDTATEAARPALAEGWVKRVLGRLNQYESRIQDLLDGPEDPTLSLISQAGTRYEEADIPLTDDPANLKDVGLIEAYETVLRRAKRLSLDADESYDTHAGPDGDDPLLLATSRIAALYMQLADEAVADVSDPTIPFTGQMGEELSRTSSMFAFQNQLPSLLEEELALLRGRDDHRNSVRDAPYYNRLRWNLVTQGDGAAAYVQTYRITDVHTGEGSRARGITIEDAKRLYPQGHGDAWGHYLTALKAYYGLLRHDEYDWSPRSEGVVLDGKPLHIDFADERRFARAAADKARVGAQIVNLSFRKFYKSDDRARLAGYPDPHSKRAWGPVDWARRAGQGAYFDWIVGNAILPPRYCDPARADHSRSGCDPDADDVRRIDRATVPELNEVPLRYRAIQLELDRASAGLNPLGLVRDMVPFGLDPDQLESQKLGHFDQIYDTSLEELERASRSFEHMATQARLLRKSNQTAEELGEAIREREFEMRNRLVQIFGSPYAEDVGAGRTYPKGYKGPDIYHYNYVDEDLGALFGEAFALENLIRVKIPLEEDVSQLFSERGNILVESSGDGGKSNVGAATDVMRAPIELAVAGLNETGNRDEDDRAQLGELRLTDEIFEQYEKELSGKRFESGATRTVSLYFSPTIAGFVKPANWRSQRSAPGELQLVRAAVLRELAQLRQEVLEYHNLMATIQNQVEALIRIDDVHETEREVLRDTQDQIAVLQQATLGTFLGRLGLERTSRQTERIAVDMAEGMPKTNGTSNDVTSGMRLGIRSVATTQSFLLRAASVGLQVTERELDFLRDHVEREAQFELLAGVGKDFEKLKEAHALLESARREPIERTNIFKQYQAVREAEMRYRSALAEGERLLEALLRFRRETSAEIEKSRYADAANRMLRSEAMRSYRAEFDAAARYTYLAAKAFDYETGGHGASRAGVRSVLDGIMRKRTLGDLEDGEPIPGEANGLAGVLGTLKAEFQRFKTNSGYRAIDPYYRSFSLRSELFRIPNQIPAGEDQKAWEKKLAQDEDWAATLSRHRVPDLRKILEFQRCCHYQASGDREMPGIVIPFSTRITQGRNLFGMPLESGDETLPANALTTRILGSTIVFEDYSPRELGLVKTPQAFLVPVGRDLTNDPDGAGAKREWRVVDLKLPRRYVSNGRRVAGYGINLRPGEIRPFIASTVYSSEVFDRHFSIYDYRLAGRSIENTRWLLIIPGSTLLSDPDEGLDRLLGVDEAGNYKGGSGISDVKLYFRLYSYGPG